MKILKKIFSYLYYLATLGWGAYRKFRKERKKYLVMIECFEEEFKRSEEMCAIIQDIYSKASSPNFDVKILTEGIQNLSKYLGQDAMKKRLTAIQIARNVWHEIKADLKEINS